MARLSIAVLLKPRTWAGPYVLLWFLVGLLPFQPTDLDIFFWPSAKVAVAGHPLLVYSAGGQATYPNANGPVALVPLTAIGVLLNALGWLDSNPQRRAAALALFAVFVILMAREAVAAIERLRGEALSTPIRLFAFGIITLSPPVWQSVAGYGHIEQPVEIWLLLVAVRWLQAGGMLKSGAALALAILSRSSAVLMAAPMGLASWRAEPRAAVAFFAGAGGAGASVLLPFYLADAGDLTHSLFTYRGSLPVGAGSIWSVTAGTSLATTLVQHWDIAAVAALVVAVNLWLATRPGGYDASHLFAGMALTAASFALLAKTVWPYYFFEVFVFGTVWAAGRWRTSENLVRLALLPLAISTFGLIAEIGSAQYEPIDLVRIEGTAMFAMLSLTMAWGLWLAGRSEAGPGIAAAVAPFQKHGLEAANQLSDPD